MTVKTKILEALNITFDDISEDRLLDILLDAYKSKDQAILRLEGENACERERMRGEYHRMRSDPLYCREGAYYFAIEKARFTVLVQSDRVDLMARSHGHDVIATPMSPEDWLRQ
jgi:hypothetical protein